MLEAWYSISRSLATTTAASIHAGQLGFIALTVLRVTAVRPLLKVASEQVRSFLRVCLNV